LVLRVRLELAVLLRLWSRRQHCLQTTATCIWTTFQSLPPRTMPRRRRPRSRRCRRPANPDQPTQWLALGTFCFVGERGPTRIHHGSCSSPSIRMALSAAAWSIKRPISSMRFKAALIRTRRRVAFTIGDAKDVVFETGIYNLTQQADPGARARRRTRGSLSPPAFGAAKGRWFRLRRQVAPSTSDGESSESLHQVRRRRCLRGPGAGGLADAGGKLRGLDESICPFAAASARIKSSAKKDARPRCT